MGIDSSDNNAAPNVDQDHARSRLLERLIGAGILLLIAVIAIPLILNGPHNDQSSGSTTPGSTESSSRDEASGHTVATTAGGVEVILLGDDDQHQRLDPKGSTESVQTTSISEASKPKPADTTPVSSQPNAAASSTGSSPDSRQTSASSQSQTQGPATVSANNAQTVSSNANLPAGAWQVQLGSFSIQSYAETLRDRAVQAGYQAYVMSIEVNDKTYYRVRVKPATTKAAAQARAATMSDQLGISASAVVTQ